MFVFFFGIFVAVQLFVASDEFLSAFDLVAKGLTINLIYIYIKFYFIVVYINSGEGKVNEPLGSEEYSHPIEICSGSLSGGTWGRRKDGCVTV